MNWDLRFLVMMAWLGHHEAQKALKKWIKYTLAMADMAIMEQQNEPTDRRITNQSETYPALS